MTDRLINLNKPWAAGSSTANRQTRQNFAAVNRSLGDLGAGSYAFASLRLDANVADGETVTIAGRIYEFDNDEEVADNNVLVDVSGGLTPASASAALVAAFNANPPLGSDLVAVKMSDNEVCFVNALEPPQNIEIECDEDLAGANNAIDSKTRAGVARSTRHVVLARVPTAQEVALGALHVFLPFDPSSYFVRVVTTATGEEAAWDGGVTITPAAGDVPAIVTLDNDGDVDWATTSTIQMWFFE